MTRARLAPLAATAVGAGLVALSFPRGGCWPLGWFCLAPLFVCLDAGEAAAGFLAGWAFNAAAFFWIFGTCRFAHFSLLASALSLACLSLALSVNWTLASLLGRRIAARAPKAARPWIWAAVFTAVTFASERWTTRIPGDLLGYTQWRSLALVQAGAWGGPHLLGFAVLLVNAALAEAWVETSQTAAANLALAAALAGGLWAHGQWVLLDRPADPGPTARVEILQPNVDQYAKWNENSARAILDGFYELLALPETAPPALVVWPETAIPRRVPPGEPVAEGAYWAAKKNAPQLVGVITRSPSNAAQLVLPDASLAGGYEKRELVPFGEYVPFRRLVPRWIVDRWLKDLDNFGDLSAGPKDPPLLSTPFGATAVTICYEAAFPRWARRDAARGARLLVNLTNDGWYKDTWGPSQHFGMNVFRAVENRIPVIRCGNTGISGVIDPWGVVTASLPLGARGRLDADVPLTDFFPRRSLYARRGDWFGTLCLVFTAFGLLL